MFRLIAIVVCLLTLSGCVNLNSLSMTQVPEARSNLISASAHDWNFLGFVFDNDFVDEAVSELKQKCEGGKLQGVLTKHQTTAYLLVFKREVIASGYCNKA